MHVTRSLYLLGPMRIEHGKQAFSLKYTRARGLLAYLALQPGFHTRGALADLLWPDEDVQSGRDKLKRMLFHLRETLGETLFESDRQVVRLRPEAGLWVDAHAFANVIEQAGRTIFAATGLALAGHLQQLADAVALYQGPFLQGLSVRDTPDLEQWIELQRDEFLRRLTYAEHLLADGYARLGDLDQAIAHARDLVALAPLEEGGWQCLLELLLRSGQRAEAEAEFARLGELLQQEVGELPGEALVALLAAPPARVQAHAAGPERRQITVVAIEFTTGLDEDPDRLVAALRPPLVQCENILRQAWGYTVRTPGGGLLGYFGYPMALEGAGRHAVQAALRCAQVSAPSVRVGLGVHTGVVISSAADDTPDTGGRVSRLATHLGELAGAGDVLLCEATQRLVAAHFATTPHGTLRDRHANQDIAVHRVSADRMQERRARRRASMLFGRDAAMAELSAAHMDVRNATRGPGVMCLLMGEAGIGKTALARHFVATHELRTIELACAQDGVGTPFHPLARWLREQPAPDAMQLPHPAALAHAQLQTLFDAAASPSHGPLAWKQAVLEAVPSLLAALLPDGGVLHIDDVHWADPSTQELLTRLVEAPPPGRLLLVSARPEFAPPWRRAVPVRQISLPPLDPGAAAATVRAATPRVALPASLRERIVGLAEGVPLFLQELARTAAANQGARSTAGMPMPASLQELMMARIDATGNAKPVAHFASCLGTAFSTDVLVHASGKPAPAVERALDTLVACGLLHRHSGARYVFRHALLHKAAYDAQAQERREDAHRRIAAAMTERDPSIVEHEPERLAWHFRQAGDLPRAVEHYRLAGTLATARQAYREACAHYQSALDALLQCEATPESARQQLTLRMGLGVPLVALHGYGSEPARHNFEAALTLAQPMGDDSNLFPVYWGLWLGSSSWSDYQRSIALSHKLVRIAEQAGASALAAHAYYALGNSLCSHGDFQGAVKALQTGVAAYRSELADTGLGEDARVTGLSFLSWALWFTGRHEASLSASWEALALARSLGRQYSLVFALVFAAILHRLRREVALAEALAIEAADVANEAGVALWAVGAQTLRGWARASRGDTAGLESITDSVGRLGDIMGGVEAIFLGMMVEACAATGDIALGLHATERGLHVSARRADAHWQAEFLRQKGDLLRMGQHADTVARPWLEHALQVAQAQASPTLIVRAASSLLRLDARTPQEAQTLRATLQAALAQMDGGEQLLDVREAHALLSMHLPQSDS